MQSELTFAHVPTTRPSILAGQFWYTPAYIRSFQNLARGRTKIKVLGASANHHQRVSISSNQQEGWWHIANPPSPPSSFVVQSASKTGGNGTRSLELQPITANMCLLCRPISENEVVARPKIFTSFVHSSFFVQSIHSGSHNVKPPECELNFAKCANFERHSITVQS